MSPVSTDELRELIADLVDEEPADVGDDDDLFELGLQSIALMRLVSRWRDEGLDVGFGDLAARPTVAAWAALLARRPDAAPATDGTDEQPTDAGRPAATDESAEFGLALLQHAYWAGRDPAQPLGGVAPHLYLEFDGPGLDPDRLAAAVRRLVDRHPMLRARITDNGRQEILPADGQGTPVVHDLRAVSDTEREQRLAATRDAMSHEMLAIERGEVFRVAVSLLPDGARLHVDVDMVAADAVSFRVLLADLAHCYAHRLDAPETEPIGVTYREYLQARPAARRAVSDAARAYWETRAADLPGAPELPVVEHGTGRPRAQRLAFTLAGDERDAVFAACRRHGLTAAAVIATAYAEVIGAWSAQPRFVVNVPLFDRDPVHPEIDRVVGDFTGSVLLEVDLTTPATFLERARAVQHRLHSDAEHAAFSGVEVLRELGRRAGEQVLAPVVFTSGLNLGELFDEQARALFGDPVWMISQGPQVLLDAQITEVGGQILVNWDVRADLLPDGVGEAMFAAFSRLVRGLGEERTWSVPVPALLPADQLAVRERVNTTAELPPARPLHHDFFASAVASGDAPAVVADSGVLGHAELADRALRVAAGLRERGVAPGEPVAVTLPRGPEQVVAVLGVLAAGGTYVPLGVEQPPARVERIRAVSGHRWAITAEPGEDRVTLTELMAHSPLPEAAGPDPEQAAYLLFTSGSTGEPKGVEVPHRAAVATLDDLVRRYRIGSGDRTLTVSALDFDLSVFDLFVVLGTGGAAVVVPEGAQRDPDHWARAIREHGVTILNCVPALLDALLATGHDLGDTLRQVLLGGDRVGTDLPGRLRERVPGCGFAGLGGTTETAIHSTVTEVGDGPGAVDPDWRCVPYGTPLDGVALRVVDHLGRDAPDHVPGELWIGGAGVAHGYRGDPDRTADRFLTLDGRRWYRTGDLARYRSDGTVEFLGRRDDQVKLNGFRVELGEVEAATAAVDGVARAVAVVVGDAVLAVAVHGTADPDTVAAALPDALPPHMVPRAVVALDRMPLTANGKIDRRAVRAAVAERVADGGDRVEPDSALERVVARVWAQVLEHDGPVGVETPLFALGGDSVLVTVIVSQLRELLDTDAVSARTVFAHPTVRELCRALRAQEPERLDAVAEVVDEIESLAEDEVDRALADR
ncbi:MULTISPECIES: non-ribosomal peptide synthetase [unclassified Pseudonocardia]|uniref:non-ribosomal peptide synthetase n=1 Tax=unclassified Pseudonocardia TaxID=2619320 RepID=UPI00094AACC5|nr:MULTISPECIES: non-ribosomal peptide synthetase [unclassified Pseudonocardia]